jgi:hypothetical protein
MLKTTCRCRACVASKLVGQSSRGISQKIKVQIDGQSSMWISKMKTKIRSAAHPRWTRDAAYRGTDRPCDVRRRYVRLKRTNLRVIGLSLNRSQKRSALLSTTPRLRTRSSTNDLAPLRRMWLLSLRHTGAFVGARQEPSCCGFATAGAEIGRPAYIVASRRKRR